MREPRPLGLGRERRHACPQPSIDERSNHLVESVGRELDAHTSARVDQVSRDQLHERRLAGEFDRGEEARGREPVGEQWATRRAAASARSVSVSIATTHGTLGCAIARSTVESRVAATRRSTSGVTTANAHRPHAAELAEEAG